MAESRNTDTTSAETLSTGMRIEAKDIYTKKEVDNFLVAKANTSDVLTYEELTASNIDVTNKIAGADNISRLITNGVFKIKVFTSHSQNNDYAYFPDVPIGYKVSALLVGNNNGSPILRVCALFNNRVGNDGAIDSGSIQLSDNGNGTSNISIPNLATWGVYHLIVFYIGND